MRIDLRAFARRFAAGLALVDLAFALLASAAPPPYLPAPPWYDEGVPPGYVALYKGSSVELRPFQGWIPPGYDFWIARLHSQRLKASAEVDLRGGGALVHLHLHDAAFDPSGPRGAQERAYRLALSLAQGLNLLFVRRVEGSSYGSGMWAHVNATSWSEIRFGDATGRPEAFIPFWIVWANATHAQILVNAPYAGTFYLYWWPGARLPMGNSSGHPLVACLGGYCGVFFDGYNDYAVVEPFSAYGWQELTIATRFYTTRVPEGGSRKTCMLGRFLPAPALWLGSLIAVTSWGAVELHAHRLWRPSDNAGVSIMKGYSTSTFLGRWRHVALVTSKTVKRCRIYLDGAKELDSNISPYLDAGYITVMDDSVHNRFVIGANAVLGEWAPVGHSEVRVYSRALSDSEASGTPGSEGLELWLLADPRYIYDVDWNGVLEWVDLSGKGRHARLSNMYWQASCSGQPQAVGAYYASGRSSARVEARGRAGQLRVSPVPQGSIVRVYAEPGQLAAEEVAGASGVVELQLPPGKYRVEVELGWRVPTGTEPLPYRVLTATVQVSPSLGATVAPHLYDWLFQGGWLNATPPEQLVRWKPVATVVKYGGSPWGSQPGGWPDPEAWWIWSGPAGTMPSGDVWLRRRFTLDRSAAATVYATADNRFTLWIDGQQVLSGISYSTTYSKSVQLAAGEHEILVKATNDGENPAGFLFSLRLDNGTALVRSDANWEWLSVDAGSNQFTLWVEARQLAQGPYNLLSKGGGVTPGYYPVSPDFALSLDGDSRPRIQAARLGGYSTGVVAPTSAANLPAPQLFAGTYDGSALRLYRNATQVASASVAFVVYWSCYGFAVMAPASSVVGPGSGYVSFAAAHARAASATEVQQLWSSRVVNATGLLLFLDPTFWDGGGYVDASGYGWRVEAVGAVQRVPALREWLWVLYGLGQPGAITFRFVPAGAMVRILQGGQQVRWFVSDGSDAVVSLPSGTYTVEVWLPGGARTEVVRTMVWGDAVYGVGHGSISIATVGVASAAAECWVQGRLYRSELVLQGSPAGPLSNYLVPVLVAKAATVYWAGSVLHCPKCSDDFSDVVFTSADGKTQLPVWVEEVRQGSWALFWVQVPALPAHPSSASVYAYYGLAPSGSGAPRPMPKAPLIETFDGYAEGTYVPSRGGAGEARVHSIAGGKALLVRNALRGNATTVIAEAAAGGRIVARVWVNASAFYIGWCDGETFTATGLPVRSVLAYFDGSGAKLLYDLNPLAAKTATVPAMSWVRVEVRWWAGTLHLLVSNDAASQPFLTAWTLDAKPANYRWLAFGINGTGSMYVDYVAALPGAVPDAYPIGFGEEEVLSTVAAPQPPLGLPGAAPPADPIPPLSSALRDPVRGWMMGTAFIAAVVIAATRLEISLPRAAALAGALLLMIGLFVGNAGLIGVGAVTLALAVALAL